MAQMIDISGKEPTVRTARASGRVTVSGEVGRLLRAGAMPKGDVFAVARVAGIMGAKRTPDLIPLCHPIGISGVEVELTLETAVGTQADAAAGTGADTDTGAGAEVRITATVRTTDRTGVEMEALTAVTAAALTVHDMVKAVDPAATITDVLVESKTGGKTGDWSRRP